MSAHSPHIHPAKRLRASSPERDSPPSVNSATAGPSPTTSEPQEIAPSVAGSAGGGSGVRLLDAGSTGTAAGVGGAGGGGAGKVGQSSNFRNVSACNRCRLRKNRCDQKLPSCASCEKANVACVGYDPITKKEIPRRLVVNRAGSNPAPPPNLFSPLRSPSTTGG